MSLRSKLGLGALLALAAAPTLAQPGPPMPPNPVVIHRFNGGMLMELSPAGRRIMRDAMRIEESDAERAALTAARQRVLHLLEADRLDVAGLRQAMAEERRLADRRQQRRQDEMLAALRRLSTEDRRAFAEGMRDQHERVERVRRDIRKRMLAARKQAMERAEAGAPGDE